uniref:CDC20/Fizzy WD40 domain-containing protein n=1 Tax=Aplanochytrium stocchinoi TaxID=215587 RepID=A0A6S8FS00_9STRA|mmetsp:Transcript_1036/g.1517  ORF Transcript_1036/g.1517 Transcript_1036/m.1517 type:complete len:494 (+) Transcript_1036:226-1707(+)
MATARDYVKDQVELEQCLDFGQNVESSVVPRWKRKAMSAAVTPGSRKRSANRSKTPSQRKKTPKIHDRFIPNRRAMDLENKPLYNINSCHDQENDSSRANLSPTRKEFNQTLANNMGAGKQRVLAFKNKAPQAETGFNSLKVVYSQNKCRKPTKSARHISSAPERILDAPELVDDYYLNLLDWGSANILAIALGKTLYLWNAEKGDITELCQTKNDDDFITSVKFVQEGGGYLAIGTNFSETQLWDIETCKMLRSMNGHEDRISSLSWNDFILSSGSRDSAIVNHDVRVAQHKVSTFKGHEQEVCGLAWSPDGKTLASGGNDNLLCLWEARGSSGNERRFISPRHKVGEHQAAVKALSWCPHQRNVLASGGGTADRTIKLWNAANGAVLNSIDTGSQVCSLVWNPHEKELLSSHGFSENQLSLWNYPSMAKTKELTGHTSRVLHMAVSPCGTMVCSAAADETLRFWKVFEPMKKPTQRSRPTKGSFSRSMSLR